MATYQLGNDIIGKIGLLGPTRMDYSNAIAILEALAQSLKQKDDS